MPEYTLTATISEEYTISADLKIVKEEVNDPYEGEYEFTPSAETQTIPIAGMTARGDITINPIPSNYGLITWNGEYLTVS